jgi:hypothetical protein
MLSGFVVFVRRSIVVFVVVVCFLFLINMYWFKSKYNCLKLFPFNYNLIKLHTKKKTNKKQEQKQKTKNKQQQQKQQETGSDVNSKKLNTIMYTVNTV